MTLIDRRWIPLLAGALALGACGSKDKTADASSATSAPVAAVTAPAGGWAEHVVKTPDGGFQMGNPDAAVKLVEYGSLTCPHCAEFAKVGVGPVESQYVASGKVAYEYRNFVRDPYDLAAALLARCAGPGPFFKTIDQLYATQEDWIGRAQKLDSAEQKRISALPPMQMFPALAKVMGLDGFMAQRGLPAAKAQGCLTDQAAQNELIAMRDKASNQLNVTGTPSFFINGSLIDGATWEQLEPKLKAATGG